MDATRPADALAATLTRTEVQRAPFSVPGREIVQVRTEIPAGVASGWHTHPGEEVGYIVAGTVRMEIRDRPGRGRPTGSAPSAARRRSVVLTARPPPPTTAGRRRPGRWRA